MALTLVFSVSDDHSRPCTIVAIPWNRPPLLRIVYKYELPISIVLIAGMLSHRRQSKQFCLHVRAFSRVDVD